MVTFRKRGDDLVETDIDGEQVVMSLSSGEFFALQGTALEIWQLLEEWPDRAELLSALEQAYGSGVGDLADDLDAFLSQLVEARLVEQG